MRSIKIAYRRLFRKGEHSLTRTITLATGLAFGILLLSEVLYYYSFDSFYSDANRIYVVHENFKMDKSSDKMESYPRVSGAIAPGLKTEVPGIEAATRLNNIGHSVFYTEDKKSYEARFSLADEHLFEVLPRPTISGNPQEILKSPMLCMVSNKIADEMGGNVVGKMIELKEYPGKKLTIGGVFKALPENTNYQYDIVISMVSTGQFTWDGTENWMGNDRYYCCVKLLPGVKPQSLLPAVRKMQEKHQDIVHLEEIQHGEVLKYSFVPIQKIYVNQVKNMTIILSAIAFSVLLVSLLNYLLLTLSTLVNRARTSAIYKTCGAQAHNLQKMIFSETSLLFIISLIGAFLIILLLKPVAEAQVGHKPISVLNPNVIWPILMLMIVLVFLLSYLPGHFFARIPVATAFRNYRQKGNKWKLGLLSLQFVGATFIFTMLLIVTLQYDKMRNADHGYCAENVYVGSTSGMSGSKLSTVLDELKAMPEIEKIGLGYGLPTEGAPGNNISLPDKENELFNIADFYWVDENYLSILNIPVTEGHTFASGSTAPCDLLISQKGAQMLAMNTGWKDGVLGKQIRISQHGTTTIQGVFPDFIVGSISNPDYRPSVFFYLSDDLFQTRLKEDPSFSFYILVKAHEGAQAGLMKKLTDVFNLALPHQDAVIKSLKSEQIKNYDSEKGFRNAMLAGNAVILLITIMGLVGYTVTEVARRRKELAIRKISGATLSDILKIFVLDLEYMAIPAVAVGLTGAWFTANKWMENFASKVPLHLGFFLLCSLSVLIFIGIIATVNYLATANRNPVDALRQE